MPRAVKEAPSTGSAADFIPPRPTLSQLRDASKGCRGCHLWAIGTRTVFGEGPSTARVMLVGEQPGDEEDREGRPFVGPSGRLLDRALADAGIDRGDVYVTNAVKHFKWDRGEKGNRRIRVPSCAPHPMRGNGRGATSLPICEASRSIWR